MTDTLTTALERSAQPKEAKTVMDLLDRQKPELEKLLGSAAAGERFARVALTELRRTPKLYECDPLSFLGALMLSAQLGLEPGPLGHVYLVPFKRECQFILGYKGMVDLAYRSGLVKDVETAVVFEGDDFDWRKGSRKFLDYTPSGPAGEREMNHPRGCAYALARLKTGGVVFEAIFPEDVEKAKARSANATSPLSPWTTDLPAMIRKTAVRRLSPMLPQSPAFALAMQADETAVEPPEELEDGGQA